MKRSALIAALLVSVTAPAVAADLSVKARPMAPVMAPVWNWNGFYIGGNAGYSWGLSRTTVGYFNPATGAAIVPPAGSVTNSDFKLDGAIAGGQIGYNWQSGSWVLGLEADAQWSGEKGSSAFLCAAGGGVGPGPCVPGLTFLPPGLVGTTVTLNQSIEWFGTFRARAGLLVTPSILAYVTGGLAFGSIASDGAITTANPFGAAVVGAFSSKSTNAGWTAGGGIEAHLGGNWTGKAEYLYMDLGSVGNTVAINVPPTSIGARIDSRITDHIARVGLNYHFSPGPVVARY
jgi:outer membrane immunogenic protein